MQPARRSNSEQYRVIAKANSQLTKGHDTGAGEGGDTWVNFCWVRAAGLSEPLPHYSSLYSVASCRPHPRHLWANL